MTIPWTRLAGLSLFVLVVTWMLAGKVLLHERGVTSFDRIDPLPCGRVQCRP